jgi:hypothetical protein
MGLTPLLAFSYGRPEASWTFVHVNSKDQETLTFQPYLSMNDFAGLTPALLRGAIRPADDKRPVAIEPSGLKWSSGGIIEIIIGASVCPKSCAIGSELRSASN